MTIQYISKRLGYADINRLVKVYSHLLKEFEDKEDEDLLQHLQKLADY